MGKRPFRTVREKYEYNKQRRGNEFSAGYIAGVEMYTDYGNAKAGYRDTIRTYNKSFADTAKTKKDQFSIGYMCALRDCAKERRSGNVSFPSHRK